MKISHIIKELRKEKHLSQEELAEQLNVSPQAVSKWETDTSLPDISQVVPIAHFFGVSTDMLFGIQPENYGEEIAAAHERYLKHRKWDFETVYNELSALMKKYPSNHTLLLDYIHVCDTMLGNKKGNRDEIFAESERCASILLTYSRDFKVLQKTYALMAQIYRAMKKFDKAEEYINILSPAWEDTQGALRAQLYLSTREIEKREYQLKENIRDLLDGLLYNIIHLGNNESFEAAPDNEAAIEIYKKVGEIAHAVFGDDYEAPVAFQVCQSLGKIFLQYIEVKDIENSLKYLKLFCDYAIKANTSAYHTPKTLLFNEYEDLDHVDIETGEKERLGKRYLKWAENNFTNSEVNELLGNDSRYKHIKEDFYDQKS